MSSHMIRSLIQLNRSAGQGSEIPALTEDVIGEISNEENWSHEHANEQARQHEDEVQRLKDGLRKMTLVAQDAGARHAILKETLASLSNADEFVNVIVDRRATCSHRCQACGGFYVVIVALMSLCFSTVITYYGNPAAALCTPLILSGNPQACLEYARMQMHMKMQKQMQQCKCGSEVSGAFNVYDIEYDWIAPKRLSKSIFHTWHNIEKQQAPVPWDITSRTFSATTTLAFCTHVRSSPQFSGYSWSSKSSCEECSAETSIENTLLCMGI